MNLNKRINKLEELHALKKEIPSAWVAMIAVDGKVKLSHANHDTIHLANREELHQFIAENDLNEMAILIVDIVNAKGELPKEL